VKDLVDQRRTTTALSESRMKSNMENEGETLVKILISTIGEASHAPNMTMRWANTSCGEDVTVIPPERLIQSGPRQSLRLTRLSSYGNAGLPRGYPCEGMYILIARIYRIFSFCKRASLVILVQKPKISVVWYEPSTCICTCFDSCSQPSQRCAAHCLARFPVDNVPLPRNPISTPDYQLKTSPCSGFGGLTFLYRIFSASVLVDVTCLGHILMSK
jgi:hypothetical protein